MGKINKYITEKPADTKSLTDWARIDAMKDEDIDYSDIPELTYEDLARMRPAAEVVPEIVAAHRRGRGKQKHPRKISTTLRLSPEVVEFFKADGPGWQQRINQALKEWSKEHKKAV